MSLTSPFVVVDDAAAPGGGVIRTIRLNRPEKRNALNPALLAALTSALPTTPASATQPIRVVVVCGAGDCFSAGFDIEALDDDERARGIDPIGPTAAAIADCPVPVIAAIVGHCHGGAVELAAACHIVTAQGSCRFSIPAVRLGLVYPGSGLKRLRRRLGAAAERVLLTGMTFSASDAHAWGLVHDVEHDALAAAITIAEAIALASPVAVSGTLRALRAVDDNDDAALAAARADALDSADVVEGVAAAKEKRPPRFSP
jgi:enoyl-CoA hydratase/carnithine racemase